MKIVLLGYNSFVGNAISKYFKSVEGVELIHVGRQESPLYKVFKFEVVNNEKMLNSNISNLLIELNLDSECVLINCISMSDVDKCEMDKEACRFQNSLFVSLLYRNLKQYDFKKLIHLSSNAVYDGNNAPYNENSECQPINYYGKVKLEADKFLLDYDDSRVMVVRPITMYGRMINGGRHNPVSLIINSIKNKQPIKLVNDVTVNILYVGDLIKSIEKLISIDFSGSINISGDEIYSRYSLGLKVAEILNSGLDLIEEVSSSEFKTVASRPLNTSFDNSLMKEYGVYPRTLKQVISNF